MTTTTTTTTNTTRNGKTSQNEKRSIIESPAKNDDDDDAVVVGGTSRIVRGALVVFVASIAYGELERDRDVVTANASSMDMTKDVEDDVGDDPHGTTTPRDAFLDWFVRNGGEYHPIELGYGTTTNVTITEFESYGGWGLALTVPMMAGGEAGKVGGTSSDGNDDDEDADKRPNADDECLNVDCDGDVGVSGGEAGASSNANHTPEDVVVPIIKRLDPLFTVPSSLIITVKSVLETYDSSIGGTSSHYHLPNFESNLNDVLDVAYPNDGPGPSSGGSMGLERQDVIIASYLMAEDCHNRHPGLFVNDGDGGGGRGGGSFWKEYLDVLPKDGIIPRLDTFDDEEYDALHDATLEYVGRESRRLLVLTYGNYDNDADVHDGGGDGRVGLRAVVRDMIRRKIGGPTSSSSSTPTLPPTSIVPDSCISFDAFHRFVAIVSSRAMVLKGVKQ